MNKLYFLISSVFLTCLLTAQAQDSAMRMRSFDSTAVALIKAFQKGDSAAINRFIHPKLGVYSIERPGAFNAVFHHRCIDYGYGGKMKYEAHQGIKFDSLRYGVLPDYSCATEKWNKNGAFADTVSRDTLLSSSAVICNRSKGSVRYSQKQITSFKELEQKSFKVILTAKYSASLMFSLSYIDGKWWLTILDCVSDDCSA